MTYTLSRAMNLARSNRGTVSDPVQRTPDGLFRQLDAEFAFTLDAASSDRNTKCERHFTIADDALGQDWGTARVWLNPPFGRGLMNWLRKAWEAFRFVRGRIRFLSESGREAASSIGPHAILVFRPALTGERDSLAL